MPTSLSISIARARAARRDSRWCTMAASAIWSPTVNTGLSDVIGSWKIIAIWLPRMARSSRGASVSRLRPANSMKLPGRMCPGGSGMSRSTDRDVTVLPHPDSPTRPSVSPG